MRYYLLSVLVVLSFYLEAQENYSTLTRQALEKMWYAKDENDFKTSLNMYEEAFKIYPDSIDGTGLYKASVLAAKLKEYDKAFGYLSPLAAMEFDEHGYPGWTYVIGNYSEREYKNLLDKPRWAGLKENAKKDKEDFYRKLKDKEDEFYSVNETNLKAVDDPLRLYEKISTFNSYKLKNDRDYSLSFDIDDSTRTSFFVHLPKHYDPSKRYAVMIILHGAVRANKLEDYQLADRNLGGWNRFYTKYADQNDVILVLPKGSRKYNWMWPDEGFYMIPEIVQRIKKSININDDKVFISGHSNGATGSFSYLMKQPSAFSGFYGFNTYPKVFTGGTFAENIKNRSFINFSTDEDYYYPPNANDDFTKMMTDLGADYQEHRYIGFPHWFPSFDESEAAYKILFADLVKRERDPFPKKINWEFDDEKYGNIDWLSDIKLDTSATKASWHKEVNFKVTKWLDFKDEDSDDLIEIEVDKTAFDMPRKSGKIVAAIEGNTYRIKTSRIKAVSINISPEMVDLEKNIKVYINEKVYFDEKVEPDSEFILRHFEEKHDRKQIWVNQVTLEI